MRTIVYSKLSILMAVSCVVLIVNIWASAACQKTVPQSIITYNPTGSTCVAGKTKKVCTGTTCGNAASGQQGKVCCTPGTTTTSCNLYVGVDPWYRGCYWDDAGIANGTTPVANLSGDDCTG